MIHFSETATTAAAPEFEFPSSYDYTVQIPKATLMLEIMTAIVLILAVAGMFIYINRKHKLEMFPVIGGIAVYIVFFYYAPNYINLLYLIPGMQSMADSVVFNVSVVAILSAVFGIGGRLLSMKMFKALAESFRGQLAVGVGIASAMAIYVAFNSFFDYINCNFIDMNGYKEAILATASSCETQEDFNKLVSQLYSYYENGTAYYVYQLLEQLTFMVFHVACTLPLITAYSYKESKLWYAFAFGTYFVALVAKFLRILNVIPGFVEIIIIVLVTAGTVYVALRMYRDYYKDEPRDDEKKKPKIEEPKKKPMPKFGNLSEL